MCLSGVDKKINIWLLVLFMCLFENVFSEKPYKEGRAEYPKGCAYLRCKRGDQCVNRKFWCKNSPCPSMLYCSKSRKESLKGPSSCEFVRCTKGFICLVRARHCRWDQACEQQIARCVTERDYYEGPASCVDFRCPSGHRCILRESLCARPPCKLLKSCAKTEDVKIWLEECRNLGCLSEQECFLRRSDQYCPSSSCKHTPDCSAKSDEDLETSEKCRGWVCPKGQECSSHIKGPCKRESCRISRSCHKPLMIPVNTTPSPRHSWRDDIKLSFYSKREKNSSAPGKNRFSSRSFANENFRGSNNGNFDKKNSMNHEDRNISPIDKEHINKLPNSRPTLARPDITSGRVVKPTVTSLTTWLNHLKLMTGVDAIEMWIKRADRQEKHAEFLHWLKSVKDMLGSTAYDLWLKEVRAMTVSNTAFQKWLPQSPSNRSTDSRQLVRSNGNVTGSSYEGHEIFLDSPKSTEYPKNEDRNYFPPKVIHETAGWKNDDVEKAKYVLPTKNETPIKQSVMTRENPIPDLPELPPTPPTIGINDWSRMHSPIPRNFQQSYPLPLPPNFSNFGPWNNQPVPYQGFDNSGLLNPSYPQFPPNRTFQQPPDNNPIFLGPKTWQDNYFPSPYPQWQQARNTPDQISPYPIILDPPNEQLGPIFPPSMEDPVKFYPRNFTNQDTSWIKYFDDPYETSQFVPPENIGSYPMADRSFVNSGWPGSGYRETNLADLPHRRSKHSGIEAPQFPQDDRNVGGLLGERISGWDEVSSPYYSRFPWNFMEPRIPDDYSHLVDYNRRNIYNNNNQDISPFLPSLSRTHRVDVDPLLSQQNPYFPYDEPRLPQSKYHWTTSYPHDRLYDILPTRSPDLPYPVVGARENKRRVAPSVKLVPSFDTDDEGTPGLFVSDRVNDVPGQTMELPDLWNSRYRNPSSSFLRKIVREQFGNRDTTITDLPSTTNLPPIVSTVRKIVTPRVLPTTVENLSPKKIENYDELAKRFEDYSVDDDDGIYPLLLSLQGYIETPSRQVFQDSSNPPKNSTILPVYTIDNDPPAEDDYDDNDEAWNVREGINFSRNEKYDERPNFPDNLTNIFEVEAALIVQNRTDDGDVDIKDIKWEYENDDETNSEDLSRFLDQTQSSVPSNDGSSNNEPLRGWIVNESGAWNDERTETDYYDEGVAYADENITGDKSYFDPDQINIDGLLNNDDITDDLNDRFYDDTEHKRFKKNRPL